MDWNKEKENLKEGSTWWKPKTGQHKIKILSEGEEYVAEYDDKERQKVRFDIETKGQKYIWGVTKGQTESSLYGQLVLIGSSMGKLAGQSITIVVMGEGKDTRYTILEAIPLMTPKEESVANEKKA